MATNPFPDATGLHKAKSPYGDFTLTTLNSGSIIVCPVTGSILKNKYTEKKDTYACERTLKNTSQYSCKFYIEGDVDILIHRIRNTNKVSNHTNEARTGTFKKSKR